ncbi:MAG: hypothetical protein ACU83N_15510 [Gammaproteobacteria bacterium]
MKNKFNIIFFFIGLVGLIIFQRELVMPLLNKVISSDLFLVETDDIGSDQAVSNELTDLAFAHCNNYIKGELDDDFTAVFSQKPINAWSIGNYQYVINGEIELSGPDIGNQIKRYVCRISYKKGSDQSGIMNGDNWSVYGLSGIDEI